MKLGFEWDEEKAKANLKKHRVDLEEATAVFTDPFSITIHDPDHSSTTEEVVAMETRWKHKLQSREMGLNRN